MIKKTIISIALLVLLLLLSTGYTKASQNYQFNPFNGTELTLSINQSPTNPVIGDQVTISGLLTNTSPTVNLADVVLTYTLPSGFSFVSCTMASVGAGCANSGQDVIYTIGDLNALGSVLGTFVFNVDSGYGTKNIGLQITGTIEGVPWDTGVINYPISLPEATVTVAATPTTLPATGAESSTVDWHFSKLISYLLLPQTITFFHL